MALTPPENSVSAAVGDEIGPDLHSEAGERPSAFTTGPADAASGSGTGGASTREEEAARDGVAAKTEPAAEAAEAGVSERGKNVGSSGEAFGYGDARKVFVEMCRQQARFETLEESAEGDKGDAQMAQTGEVKNAEAISEETTVLSVVGAKAVMDVNADTSVVSGSEKTDSAKLQVESAHAQGESKKRRGRPTKSTVNDMSNVDEQPSGDQQRPDSHCNASLFKKKRGKKETAEPLPLPLQCIGQPFLSPLLPTVHWKEEAKGQHIPLKPLSPIPSHVFSISISHSLFLLGRTRAAATRRGVPSALAGPLDTDDGEQRPENKSPYGRTTDS